MGLAALATTDEAQFDYGIAQGSSSMALLSTSSSIGSLENSRLPVFDVKAYTFRKKSRHYVAVKHRNALRIEPIIYLKTSILDNHRDVVRNWDYLRLSIHRFRENALPKKKLSAEAPHLISAKTVYFKTIAKQDGERKIMQVLAKNFKMTPAGEPVIDIRKGHAIVCIKLNCYCDHHNEHEGFVVRMQTEPEVVRLGGSVNLRICCEARSKSGPAEPEAEEEDGLTDIDAPVSTGSRSPLPNDRSVQSPSMSYGSQSPDPRGHQRHPSTNSSSIASPRSMDERVISSLAVESSPSGYDSVRGISPPAFRQIYPLTPSEGTCLGGTRVTIHGAHFDVMQNPVVFFGKVPAEMVSISHHDVMECTTPPAEGLKPGIVAVRIASLAFPLGTEENVASVDFMYMAPPDYEFYNLAATSLSYAMANEYPSDNSLAYILQAHGSGPGAGLGQGLFQGTDTLSGDTLDVGFAWRLKEDMALDFLRAIQILAPGRILPAFQSETGHTLLHYAAQNGMIHLAKELLEMGIDHTAVDRNRKTALHFAQLASSPEMVSLLSKARVPPRPMVPRLTDTSISSTDTTVGSSSMKDIVKTLVQKHENTLSKALIQEQERKGKELAQLRIRSLSVMELRDQPLVTIRPPTLSIIDTEGEEFEQFSEESSPSTSKSSDDGEIEDIVMGEDRKRKAADEPATSSMTKKLAAESMPVSMSEGVLKAVSIDPTQMAYIQNGIKHWESTRGVQIFGEMMSTTPDILIWACESAAVTSLKGSSTDADSYSTPSITSSESTLTVLALSTRGLHLYLEQLPARDSTAKRLEHWSLAEIDNVSCIAQKDSKDVLSIDMFGMVPGGSHDLAGERIQIMPASTTSTSEISKTIGEARSRLIDSQMMANQNECIESLLTMWGTLLNIDKHDVENVIKDDQLELDNDTLIVKAALDDKRYSLAMITAIFRTARDLQDACVKIKFRGATVVEDGWDRPELIRELEGAVHAMKHVSRWEFSSCGWTTQTVQGLLNGLKADPMTQCREISLAGNRFGGEDAVGHLLIECADILQGLESLDLTDCDIGLKGMKELVHHLEDILELRVQGNRMDDNWWQWMDAVLEKNPQIQRCSLGAPIAATDPQKSLLSMERLESVRDLVELDLSNSPMTQHTLKVLEDLVGKDSQTLRTLNLSHCQLGWLDLTSIFRAVCDVNSSTKFTFEISKNPLFDSDEAIRDWESTVEEAHVQVPFGIQMTDLLLSDASLQRILKPLEQATCFNELNVKGLYIKREKQASELESLSYDDARVRAIPEGASTETCLALGRILTSNSTLVMLDVSGNLVKSAAQDDGNLSSSKLAASPLAPVSRSVGGFGRDVALAFPSLAKNSTLRFLSIDHNRFGEDGMKELCEAMRSNTTIGVLSCDGNDAFTPKGLQAIETIFSPVTLSAATATTAISGEETTSQEQGPHNSSLSVWKLGRDEILMHMQLLANEVHWLTGEYNQIEKMQATNMHGADIKFMGSTPLPDVMRRREAAENNRIEYAEAHVRILRAIKENNRRTKEVYLRHQHQSELQRV
ncbi:hypothetical protein BGZ58_007417 [Dissophora ornata]|nr:hypothetical protein BGZ58_007417 [Dissophora ornata]